MGVFNRLINRLHRVFNKDPQRIPAITLQSIAPYQIETTDSAINLTTDNGSVSVPLSGTVADLADALNSNIPTISPPAAVFTRDSAAIDPASGVAVAANTPRFPTLEAKTGLLLESARANLLGSTENLNDTTYWLWSLLFATATAGQPDPFGTTRATKIIEDTTASISHYVNQAITKSATVKTYTFSVYVLRSDRDVALQVESATSSDRMLCVFAIEYLMPMTPTIVGTGFSGFSANLEPAGNGFYRCSITFTASASITDIVADILLVGDTGTVYSGNGTSYLTVFGPQIEEGSFASSYIASTAGTATARAGDAATINVSHALSPDSGSIALWFNFNTSFHQNDGVIRDLFSAQNGLDSFALRKDGSDDDLSFRIGNYAGASLASAFYTAVGWHHVCVTWDTSYVRLIVDGEIISQNSAQYLNSAPFAQLDIGHASGASQCESSLYDFRLYNRALGVDEVQTIIGSGALLAGLSARYMLTTGLDSDPFAVASAVSALAPYAASGILPDALTSPLSTFDIYYPQSILYKEFQVYSWELDDQASRIKSLNNDFYMHSATDTWLEYWLNDHFNIPRYQSETDAEYFTRAKYEIIALKVNNKALENLVFNALGVKVRILDAYPLRSELAPQDQPSAAGRFVLDMSIPNALSTADAQELIDRVKAIVRKYRAAGTDFINALRKYEALLETQPTAESMTATIGMPDIEEGPRPGLIYVGAGWRIGTPGLVVGTNDGIKEQILVKKLNSDGTLAAQYLYGG